MSKSNWTLPGTWAPPPGSVMAALQLSKMASFPGEKNSLERFLCRNQADTFASNVVYQRWKGSGKTLARPAKSSYATGLLSREGFNQTTLQKPHMLTCNILSDDLPKALMGPTPKFKASRTPDSY